MGNTKRRVETAGAPAAIGPYSQGVVVESLGLVFSSGQIGMDPATGDLVPGGIEAEMRRVLLNLQAVLEAAGSGMDRVLRTTLYLVDMGEFTVANAVYAEHVRPPLPARSTVAVAALPKGARVEMDVIAALQ